MERPRLVLASANPDKVAEMELLLKGVAEVLPRPPDLPDVVEDGDTLEANARLKAVAVCSATGLAAIADDTGLFVDALGGHPRCPVSPASPARTPDYADNLAKLMADLAGVVPAKRTARFRTVVLVRYPDGRELVATGTVEGRIAETPSGERGFGYDPVFIPVEGDGATFAEMGDDKHSYSHRGRALRALVSMLDSPPVPDAG